LPHELLLPKAREWEYGTPKAEIEPLIDFWYASPVPSRSIVSILVPRIEVLISRPGLNTIPGALKNHTSTPRSPSSVQPFMSLPPARTFPFESTSCTSNHPTGMPCRYFCSQLSHLRISRSFLSLHRLRIHDHQHPHNHFIW
jgi:hypothetical protein